MTKTYIKNSIIDNVSTETLYRKWYRRFLVALTEDEIEKCKYHLNKYKFLKR